MERKKERKKGREEGGLPACWSVRATPTLTRFRCELLLLLLRLGDRWNKPGAFSSSTLGLVWLVGAAAGAFECYNQHHP